MILVLSVSLILLLGISIVSAVQERCGRINSGDICNTVSGCYWNIKEGSCRYLQARTDPGSDIGLDLPGVGSSEVSSLYSDRLGKSSDLKKILGKDGKQQWLRME